MNTIKTVAIATLVLGLTSSAQPPQHRRGGDAGPGIGALKEYLALTDTQLETIRSARKQEREAMRANAQQMQAKHKALRDQMDAGSADPTAIGNMMLELRSARQKAQAARRESGKQLLSTLTPEQKTKLQELQAATDKGPAAHEAMRLGLIDPPAGEKGAARSGGAGRRFRGGPPPERF